MKEKRIPEPTLRRLPAYLRFSRRALGEGREQLSTTDIAQALELEQTQVRKDLSAAGAKGRPRVGYLTEDLIVAIEGCLGWRSTSNAFLVGAGNLGRALLGDPGLAEHGLEIVCAFDEDGRKVGAKIHGREVLSMSRLRDLGRRMHINIGVLTVPGDAAQRAAEALVEAGVVAIWNFTPSRLVLPEHVVVVDVDIYASLAILSRKLERMVKPTPKEGESHGH